MTEGFDLKALMGKNKKSSEPSTTENKEVAPKKEEPSKPKEVIPNPISEKPEPVVSKPLPKYTPKPIAARTFEKQPEREKLPETAMVSFDGHMEILKPTKTYKNETTAVIDYLPEYFEVLGTKAKQVARPDLPVEFYLPRYKENAEGEKIVVEKSKGNFDLYNFDLNEKLSSFSNENKEAGGVAITRSQITEACLDFIFYDLELRPNGFKSTEDVRNYLRSLIK